MAYFTDDFLQFFRDLEKNNHKEWFDENRKRYKTSVKDPFYSFVDHMIGLINHYDPTVQISAKDAVMRINRDIRFSPDKTPYNVHYGAIISSAGRKNKSIPGLFIRFSPEYLGVFGGAHGIDKNQLQKIRNAIAEDLQGFSSLVNQSEFKTRFGEIKGEKHKRIPPEFKLAFDREPLIAHKEFYYVARLDPGLITEANLPATLMEYWQAANPVREFLIRALNS
ncbi:MAG: TIGR02453 family protein [Cyclobacteriaceae bacterium]|nr:MAG: TIGR02453 family protein [Cyclobacteriaceae bacterium]